MDLEALKKSRRFYCIFCPVLVSVAALSFFTGHAVRAGVLAAVSLALLTLHLALPDPAAALFEVYSSLMSKIGALATKVFMILFFYAIFTPYGFIVRVFQGDALKREIDASVKSYWISKSEADNDSERCERPF